jgi:hypothetical protein
MHGIDYMGAQGGALAMAFASGCVATSGLLVTVGGLFWKLMFNPRIKELKTLLDKERVDSVEARRLEREQCNRQIEQLRDRIVQLETLLLANGPSSLRQAKQAVISEARVMADAPARDRTPE